MNDNTQDKKYLTRSIKKNADKILQIDQIYSSHIFDKFIIISNILLFLEGENRYFVYNFNTEEIQKLELDTTGSLQQLISISYNSHIMILTKSITINYRQW